MTAVLDFSFDLQQPFALIEKEGFVRVYQGKIFQLERLIDLHKLSKSENRDLVFVLPYCSIREKGCEARGDDPILAMAIERSVTLKKEEFLQSLPDEPFNLAGEITPSLSDVDFAKMVKVFQREAIEKGLCSQTTLSRRFSGKIADFTMSKVLSLYRHLLFQPGHYMTVLFAQVDTKNPGNSQFILAGTPERHLEIRGNETIMCPIAGTCRKEDAETFPERLKSFLNDPKEINELFQVLDEEMKMMGAVCPKGGEIHGPYLREVGAVVHSEYMLVGRRSTHSLDALRGTLHAPTVVGSPLISAARLIAKYEPDSRRYYAGEIGIYHQSRTDTPDGDLDCAILIRGAEISGDGSFSIQAGAGIVRDSNPENEAQETRAKAMGLLRVLTGQAASPVYMTEALQAEVRPLLVSRNAALSTFWRADQGESAVSLPQAGLRGKSITIVNNEDDFAYMLGHMIRSFGVEEIKIVDTFAFDAKLDKSDLVLIGPGPGDPTDMADPRMKLLQEIIRGLSAQKRPMLGICLGHQALAVFNGIPVKQQKTSTQGMPRQVKIRGEECRLGFYNSFSPVMEEGAVDKAGLAFDTDETGRIIAMHGDETTGYQFHPESVMSVDGRKLMLRAVENLLRV